MILSKRNFLITTVVAALLCTEMLQADNDWTPTLTVTPQSGNTPLSITVRTDIQDIVNYTVRATAGSGGSISPPTNTAAGGSTTSFNVSPLDGYGIKSISGCGGTLDGTTYTTGALIGDCSIDVSFGMNDGRLITDIHSRSQGKSIKLQNDGKIVVYGQTTIGRDMAALIVRYNRDGSLDRSFGNGGWFTNVGDL